MKKLVSGLLSLLLTLMATAALALTAAPANASESKKEAICKATSSGSNPFILSSVARDSIINGGHGENGVNAKDKIPPFDYNFDGGPVEHYPGQNWDAEAELFMAQGCSAVDNILTPVLPVSPVITCNVLNPTLTIPAQPNGINVTSAADDKGNYSVAFELPKNTLLQTYSLPKGFVNPVNISTVDNRPSDSLWDSATKTCKMPDTGAGQAIQWWMIPAAGALFFLAAMLLVLKPLIRNRILA